MDIRVESTRNTNPLHGRNMNQLVFALMLSAFCLAAIRAAQAQDRAIEAPVDSQDPVIVLDYTGGFRRPDPPGFSRTPFLRIYGDGRLITGQNAPEHPVHELQLSNEELQELLTFVIKDQSFLELDSQTLKMLIEKVPNRIQIMDAGTTEITVRTAEETHTVGVYALALIVKQMDFIRGVVQLHAIERRLKSLHTLAAVGRESADQLVEEANKFLATNHSDLPTDLSLHDLAWSSKTGPNMRIAFTRGKTEQHGAFSVTIEQDSAKSTVSINVQKQ